ncbi:MAG: hypothetical protein ACXQTI_10470 [Candidatus Nezhaarchaeales archaeon]
MSTIVEIGWIIDVDAEATLSKLEVDITEASPIIIGSKWSMNVASHIMGQAADSMEIVVIAPYIDEAPHWAQLIHLGFNASFNVFKPIGDKDLHAYFIAEVFKGALGLNNAQASTLRRALLRVYSSGREPSIEEVLSVVEIEAMELRGRDAAELIEALEAMERGRLGAACQSDMELPRGLVAITMSKLPPSYASIIAITLLKHLYEEGFKGIIAICDIDYLQAFLGSSWKTAIDIIFKLTKSGAIVIANSSSISSLPLDLRARANMTIMGAPSALEDARYIEEIVGHRVLKLLNSKERHAYKLIDSSGVVEVPLEETEKIKVEESIKPPQETPKPILYVKLGHKAKMAYEILSFLRDGASTRDSVISYAMHRLDVSSLEASRLINALLTHGLASEVVGADGKYWLKITVKGLNAIEELEALEGWLT